MLRKLLLMASRSGFLQALALKWPLARRLARRFVAGETLGEAVAVAREFNSAGLPVSLDCLGESVSTAEEAEAAAKDYLETLAAIGKERLDAEISLKLTQLGLGFDDKLCERLLRTICRSAERLRTTVCVDMEGSGFTERTVALYMKLRPRFPNLGVAVQAYLRRSEGDIRNLVALGPRVRLCKGAYDEPKEVAFREKGEVDHSYLLLAGMLFSEGALSRGTYPCLATHDERIIGILTKELDAKKASRKSFEFQMLYGIRPALQRSLAKQGHRVRIYVPYGTHWYPYFMRRLAERPANIWFLIKNLFRR